MTSSAPVRITVISDTHLHHEELRLPGGDLLIHCGDMLEFHSGPAHLADLDRWFGRQPYDRILCTGGNHDLALEHVRRSVLQPFRNAYFLQDEVFCYRWLRIYGAPWVPDLRGHAFYKDRAGLAAAWARVPAGLDILITHTPATGILDRSSRGGSHGCQALASAMGRIAPRVHCFGHVHASAGRKTVGSTLHVNAALLLSGGGGLREPFSFDLSPSR